LREGDRYQQVADLLYETYNLSAEQFYVYIAERLANALDLLNTTLGSPVTETRPLDYMEAPGNTLHLGDSVGLVGI
jgi:hypothetical protein